MKKAFSLIELSVVLVIVGLIISAISGGGKLIAAATYRSFVNELSEIRTAHSAFVTIYGTSAGDLDNASSYFNDASCPAGNAPAGCNGDGDKRIDIITESYRYWQHLELAKLSSKHFTGLADPSGTASTPPWSNRNNLYESNSYIGALFLTSSSDVWDSWMDHVDSHDYTHIDLTTKSYYSATSGFISPKDLWNVDKKFDDGLPATGLLIGAAFHDNGVQYGIGGNYCTTLNATGSTSKTTRHASRYNKQFSEKLCKAILSLATGLED